MRKICVVLLTGLVCVAATAGANEPVAEGLSPPPAPQRTQSLPFQSQGTIVGTVEQTMDVRGYTYMEIETGDGRVWIAGPVTQASVGDSVEVPRGIERVGFHSKALDRTFDKIQLVHSIRVTSRQGGGAPVAPTAPAPAPAVEKPEVTGIERIEGGHTVGEVIAGRTSLAGSNVAVRGKVTKLNTGIMGRNWLHLADGTVGPDGEKDVIVTTKDVADVGSTVVVRGSVATDQDFGFGYKYAVLIENAKVTAD